MPDLWHQWGSDLAVGPTGDLAIASASNMGLQRVLRRLLTNVGDYIWQLDYGAGIAGFIGEPASASRLRALIRSQIFKEAVVARTPEPVVTVQAPSGSPGSAYVHIRYVDAFSGETQVLSFPVSA